MFALLVSFAAFATCALGSDPWQNENLLLSDSLAKTNANDVIVNGQKVAKAALSQLANLGLEIQPGRYWYDSRCGAWGFEGGPTVGFIFPGLRVGGRLAATASNGRTGIFINGRQIHAQDRAALIQLLGYALPGRYSLDQNGNVYYENGPFIVNLVQVAQSRNSRSSYYHSWNTDISSGSSGGSGYVMGKDWSVSW